MSKIKQLSAAECRTIITTFNNGGAKSKAALTRALASGGLCSEASSDAWKTFVGRCESVGVTPPQFGISATSTAAEAAPTTAVVIARPVTGNRSTKMFNFMAVEKFSPVDAQGGTFSLTLVNGSGVKVNRPTADALRNNVTMYPLLG